MNITKLEERSVPRTPSGFADWRLWKLGSHPAQRLGHRDPTSRRHWSTENSSGSLEFSEEDTLSGAGVS